MLIIYTIQCLKDILYLVPFLVLVESVGLIQEAYGLHLLSRMKEIEPKQKLPVTFKKSWEDLIMLGPFL